jgi:prephenate dehydrogenase
LGPGLLGGSVAFAAWRRGLATETRVWARRQEAVDQIEGGEWGGVAGHGASTDLESVVAGAEMIVLATPVGVMRSLAEQVAEIVKEDEIPGRVACDIGSVKGRVDRDVRPVFEKVGVPFIPCHPMAGSEKTGWENARADLFEKAVCIVTPPDDAAGADVERVAGFWEALGSSVFRLKPDEHDRIIAQVSHLPHAVASILATVALGKDPGAGAFAGNGLRDSTRVASGPPEMWAEILLENREAVAESLVSLQAGVSEILAILERKDEEGLRRFLSTSKKLRDAIGNGQN